MKIVISNIKRITQKEVKKLRSLYNALSGENKDFEILYKEYPKSNLIREVSFKLDYEIKDVLDILINYFVLIQGKEYERPKGEWFTLKIENFLLSFFDEETQKNLPINLK